MMTSEPRIYRDRLTGQLLATPPLTGTLMGRWTLRDFADEIFINSVAATTGDFLVPEPSGQWKILTADGTRCNGSVARAQIPDDLEASSVRTLSDALDEIAKVPANNAWLEWLEISPLVPGISDHLDAEPLEHMLREQFGHLEEVCRKPRAHLHIEVQRVPVSRARRIPPAAISYLAAHTEDWDRRLLRSIIPKRVLSEVRHEQVNIYENRVAARLLDNLGTYLNRRIHILRRLLRVFQEKENYSASLGGTYLRANRLSRLWGESVDVSAGRTKAESALKNLEWLKYKVMGLLGSPLYEEVPRRAFVPTTLKSTNILTNDSHYRHVAEIWREWARTGAGRTRSPAEYYEEAQRLSRGLDAFVMLLTVRAFDALGYEPTEAGESMPIVRGASLSLVGKGISATLHWRLDGSISIESGARVLTLVALSSDLSAGNDKHIRESLERVRERDSDVLVLYLSSGESQSSTNAELLASLHTVGNDPRHSLAGGGCLPVSPWELGSTERLARALRDFVSTVRFEPYPFQITIPSAARELIDKKHSDWLATKDDGRTLEMRRPPRDYEWELLDLDSTVERAEAELRTAQSTHEKVSNELRSAVRTGGVGSLNRRKSDAKQRIKEGEEAVRALGELAASVRSARDGIRALLDCPVCGTSADPINDFTPRDEGCFRCVCRGDCGTSWATRLCSNGHRYAAMLPGGAHIETEDQQPGWEDRVYGCDILALPARKPDGQWGFVCPDCGEVN